MNAQERVARILCRLMDDEWKLGEKLYRNTADEIIATLAPDPNIAPREAGIQAFYADESTTNTLQGLNAAFDVYEAAIWQPIETAPKDGTWIEAWRGSAPTGVWSNPVYVRWCQFDGDEEEEGAWCWPDCTYDVTSEEARDRADTHVLAGDFYEDTSNFTDWRPLSSPPTRSQAKEA